MGRKAKGFEMDLSLLCHQFALILKSVIHPVEGIPMLCEDTVNPKLKKALETIARDVEHGSSLYSAFEAANCFPAYMTAMIRVGEKTGMLEPVLEGLSKYYENQANTRKKIRSAVTYPLVLALFMLGVIALIAFRVVPLFVEILTSLGGQVPVQVDLFILLGNTLKNGFLYVLAALLLLAAGILALSRQEKLRFLLDKLKVVNPITGGIYRKIIASRFSGAMALTLKSGMTVTEGVGLVSGVLENAYVVAKTGEAAKAVSEGKPFWEAVRDTGLFPALFIRLMKSGEKTGSLDAVMDKASRTWQEEADSSLRRIIGFIEPVCVTALSLILAGVLLSVILPLINIMASIG